jgi:release factor glutamine methyltransferase
MSTVGTIYEDFIAGLREEYDPEEAQNVTALAFGEILGFRRIDISIQRNKPLREEEVSALRRILSELKSSKPIQYILGHTWFCGVLVEVDERVLIPRRETEELVQWLVSDIHSSGQLPGSVWDICTGSGCVALAIKKEFPGVPVTAIDSSGAALLVAKGNAGREKLDINFLQLDALKLPAGAHPSLVISNPPYVLPAQAGEMSKRVLDYEPGEALFVPGADPLIFYRRIAAWSFINLPPGGKVYFEINEILHEAVYELLSQTGFSRIDFRKDLQGKIRMFRAVK